MEHEYGATKAAFASPHSVLASKSVASVTALTFAKGTFNPLVHTPTDSAAMKQSEREYSRSLALRSKGPRGGVRRSEAAEVLWEDALEASRACLSPDERLELYEVRRWREKMDGV